MKTSTSSKRSPLAFFALVFALSLFVDLLGPRAEHFSPALPLAIPSGFNLVSVLMGGYVPLIAVCIQEPPGGIRRLFSRVFDGKRIRHTLWYVPILFLNPLIYVLTYGFMLLLGRPLPELSIAWATIPLSVVVIFIEAVAAKPFSISQRLLRASLFSRTTSTNACCNIWRVRWIRRSSRLFWFAIPSAPVPSFSTLSRSCSILNTSTVIAH